MFIVSELRARDSCSITAWWLGKKGLAQVSINYENKEFSIADIPRDKIAGARSNARNVLIVKIEREYNRR